MILIRLNQMISSLTRRHALCHKALVGDRGAAAVEFALVTPAFLIMVMGIIDFSRIFWVKSTMQFAVEQAARHVMVNPTLSDTLLVQFAEDELAKVSLTGVTFPPPVSDTTDGVDFRTLTANYTFSFMIPIIDMPDIVIQARSRTAVNNPP